MITWCSGCAARGATSVVRPARVRASDETRGFSLSKLEASKGKAIDGVGCTERKNKKKAQEVPTSPAVPVAQGAE
jgi:hypothetical protein